MEDTNRKEETLRQIDNIVPDKVELKNPVNAMEKELQDTREYLDIVLQELDDVKRENLLYKRPRRNRWKGFALMETVLVVSGCVIFAIYSRKQQSIPTMNAQESATVTMAPEVNDVPVYETVRLSSDLDRMIAEFPTDSSDFTPSVVQLFGFEYLMFSNGTVSVYYRNEVPADAKNYRQQIMIDNGTRMAEYTWDYSFEGGLASLCPTLGEFFGNGEEQLIFTTYNPLVSNNIPVKLRAISADTLWEYDYLDLAEALDEIFTASYEEKGNDTVNPDMRLSLKFGNALYTYAIGKEQYIDAVYYENNLIDHDQYFKLDLSEGSIKISTIPYLSDTEYLGEYTASVGLYDNQMKLINSSYSAYVPANQEDLEKDGVITPRTSILGDNRIRLWGKKGESFLVELSDIVEPATLSQQDLTAEDGKVCYYDADGKVASIPGIDVSKFQGEIDWKQVKESGVEFAIIRVGFRGYNEGTLEIDPYFEANIKGANEAGVHVGVYFFSQAITVQEAQEEAQFVLDQIKDYEVSYPVIVDTEHVSTYAARANDLSRQTRTDIAKTFCDMVKASGYQPMIYANTKWMIMGIDLEQLADYDLWFAYYGDNLSFPYKFDMLQYSDKGSVPGIKGNVDLNISLIDYSLQSKK